MLLDALQDVLDDQIRRARHPSQAMVRRQLAFLVALLEEFGILVWTPAGAGSGPHAQRGSASSSAIARAPSRER